ncbi:ATP-binding protein [Poseidonibacter lekithochrous]|uniref:sensor histidine kinase n=1 Tax=Poseidonibacter lekithochrous TaxID=1904463 RepID=UPI0008FC9BDA|nr:ATP-binding protein [Poseidonibacter lekithochrous]QKJ22714.1 multi-sensor domain-containing two-component system histidine kinase [Poseidonibacter lekithochrous]
MNNINLIKTLDSLEDIIFHKDLNGVYTLCNKAYCDFISLTKEEIIGKTDYDLFKESDAKAFSINDQLVIKEKKELVFFESLIKSNTTLYFKSTKDVIIDEKNNVIGTLGIAKDITKQKEYETLYKINQKVLEKIINDDSLEEILFFLIKRAEEINNNMICSILLLDKNKKQFEKGFAPSLPEHYNKAVKSLIIGPNIGSCGTAAYTKKRVIVEDINTHPFWKGFTHLTKPLDLNACWSQPFFSKNNEVLGTFAIYYKKSKHPDSFELELIESFSHLVSIAVNKIKEQAIIKEQEVILIEQAKLISLGDMLENISHHWRQPLSLISTIASGLRINMNSGQNEIEEYDKSLEKIIKTTKDLSVTIDKFKNYFIKNNAKRSFEIRSTIEKAINILDSKIDKRIKFNHNIYDITLNSYENEIISVLLVLINNCNDAFIKNNIHEPEISINVIKEEFNCIIIISDNAKGIHQDIINRIFEPYFTTKDKFHGTGLGLYIVQSLLTRQLKGDIKVENISSKNTDEDFHGASFKLSIPINI